MPRRFTGRVHITTEVLYARLTEEQKRRVKDEDWSWSQMFRTVRHPDETIHRGRVYRMYYVDELPQEDHVITQQDFDEQRGECVICIEEFKIGEKVKKCSGCKPYFHEHCIFTWLKEKPICPHCKRALVSTT